MYPTKWTEEMTGFVNSSIETTMNTLNTIHEHSEKLMTTLWEQGMAVQHESRKVLNDWTTMAKKGREDYRRMVTDSINKFTEYYNKTATPTTTTTTTTGKNK